MPTQPTRAGRKKRLAATGLALTLLATPALTTIPASAATTPTPTPEPAATATATATSRYTVDDLKNLTATIDGRPVTGFDHRNTGGIWHVGKDTRKRVTLDGIPKGWTIQGMNQPYAPGAAATPYVRYTLTSPDGLFTASYTFTYDDPTGGGTTTTYTIDDLKGMTATVNGKPIPGFDHRGGTWHIGKGNTAELGNLPQGWRFLKASVEPSQQPTPQTPYIILTIASPDHKVQATYMFIQDDPTNTGDKADTTDGTGKDGATTGTGHTTDATPTPKPSPTNGRATVTTGGSTADPDASEDGPDRLASTGATVSGIGILMAGLATLGLAVTRIRRRLV